MILRICWATAVIAVASAPIDNFLDGSMTRHMLIQMPLLVVFGYCAGLLWPIHRLRSTSLGLAAIIFAMGTLVFWMLPRSLDNAVTLNWVDQIMHANMLVAGWCLAMGLPCLPFHTKMAAGVYSLAMAMATGVIYTSTHIPVCSTYSVQQQNEAGELLLWTAVVLFCVLLGRGALLLATSRDFTEPGWFNH